METIELIPQMTFAIASKNNFRYVKHAVKYIRENCYRKNHVIHIGIDGEDTELEDWVKEQIQNGDTNIMVSNGVSGIAAIYNNIAKKLSTDFIVIYHADMIAGKDMDLYLYKQWQKGLIVSATRVEPPLHPADPSKIVENFGLWPEEDVEDGFKRTEWDRFVEHIAYDSEKVTKGVFAPWLIHKEDYWAVGGHDETLNSHSEDRDLFNRFLLNGFDFVQPWSALVYHLTCRGGQFQDGVDKVTEDPAFHKMKNKAFRNYVRKWGCFVRNDEYQYPIIPHKYNVRFDIENCTPDVFQFLEPWCTNINVDLPSNIIDEYIDAEQPNTQIDLNDKINNSSSNNDVVVKFNASGITNESVNFIVKLAEIFDANELEVGNYDFHPFSIEVKKVKHYEQNLVNCKN